MNIFEWKNNLHSFWSLVFNIYHIDMDPEDADYVCTFDEYTLEKAIKELNEDPKERLGSVQALRRWIKEQPHYTCRTSGYNGCRSFC